MIWKWFKNLLMFPIMWFWEQYQKCIKDNAIVKMIFLFFFSITGLIAITVAFGLLIAFAITKANEYPETILIIIGVIWLYLYGKSRYQKEEANKQSIIEQQKQDNQTLKVAANNGLPSITIFMYLILKSQSTDIDCEIPITSAEIQMPEEKYILRNNLCFYQFKLMKKEKKLYDRETLDVFKSDVQYAIQKKLHSGENLPFDAQDIHDEYGNIFDAVVVDNIEDLGSYFQFSVVYASRSYAEYARTKQMIQMQNNESAGELSVSWDK